MRTFGASKLMFPLMAGALFAFAGCSGTGEEPDSPTPVPATPTPTPVPPFSDSFRVSSMVVGTSTQGVDVDGDGTIDNNIETALTEVTDAILVAVEEALVAAGLSTAQIKTIMSAVTAILDATLSVEGLSNAINGQIQNGNTIYTMRFDQKSSGSEDTTLFWGTGTLGFDGVTVKSVLSEQPGKIASSTKNGLFGPDDLTLTVVFDIPNTEDDLNYSLYLRNGYTSVTGYNASALADAITGGALSINDLLTLVEQVLVAVVDGIDALCTTVGCTAPVIDIDAIILQLDTALSAKADVDLNKDGKQDAFSIGLVADAAKATVVWP